MRTRACPRGARTAAVGAVAMCAVVACAGRDVTRPSPETLVLGKTTYEDVSRRFGPPDRTGTKIVNEQSVRLVSYAFASRVGAPITGGPPSAAYASRVGAPLVEGVTPVAALAFYFVDGVLVGHEFVSSYREDHTDFDESKVIDIRKGETTRHDVVGMLGTPHGEYAWPLIKNRTDRGIVYLYVHVKGRGAEMRVYEKQLVVSVASNGVVTDVDFRASGER